MKYALTWIVLALLYVDAVLAWSVFAVPPVNPRLQPLCVSRQELTFLQEYHGTIALKIEGSKVSIWRDGKWLDITKWRERYATEHRGTTGAAGEGRDQG